MAEQNLVENLASSYGTIFKIIIGIGAILTPLFFTYLYYKWTKVSTLFPFLLMACLFSCGYYFLEDFTSNGWIQMYGIILLMLGLLWSIIWVATAIYKLFNLGLYRKRRLWFVQYGIFWDELQSHSIYLLSWLVFLPFLILMPFANDPAVYNNIGLDFLWYFSMIIGGLMVAFTTFLEFAVILELEGRIRSYIDSWVSWNRKEAHMK